MKNCTLALFIFISISIINDNECNAPKTFSKLPPLKHIKALFSQLAVANWGSTVVAFRLNKKSTSS